MGQRAPNRAAGREEGRGLGSSLRLGAATAATSSPRRDYPPRWVFDERMCNFSNTNRSMGCNLRVSAPTAASTAPMRRN